MVGMFGVTLAFFNIVRTEFVMVHADVSALPTRLRALCQLLDSITRLRFNSFCAGCNVEILAVSKIADAFGVCAYAAAERTPFCHILWVGLALTILCPTNAMFAFVLAD